MTSPPVSPETAKRRSLVRNIVAWTLVAIAVVIGFAASAIGAVATLYSVRSGVWMDGALYALSYSAWGVGAAVVLAVVALVVGRGLWVRVAAVVVIVGVIAGTAVQGGNAAVRMGDAAATARTSAAHVGSA